MRGPRVGPRREETAAPYRSLPTLSSRSPYIMDQRNAACQQCAAMDVPLVARMAGPSVAMNRFLGGEVAEEPMHPNVVRDDGIVRIKRDDR